MRDLSRQSNTRVQYSLRVLFQFALVGVVIALGYRHWQQSMELESIKWRFANLDYKLDFREATHRVARQLVLESEDDRNVLKFILDMPRNAYVVREKIAIGDAQFELIHFQCERTIDLDFVDSDFVVVLFRGHDLIDYVISSNSTLTILGSGSSRNAGLQDVDDDGTMELVVNLRKSNAVDLEEERVVYDIARNGFTLRD